VNRPPVYLSAARYELGEIEADHTTIADLPARARTFRMAPDPKLWGWGKVRRTERGTARLAIDSGQASLRAAGIDAAAVDAVALCSTRFPGGAESHGAFVSEILTGLGTPDAAFVGITLNRCTNLLAGIDVAEALVASGRHRTVLVVTTDRIDDESTRMENFALFSDGAASCLVGADSRGEPAYQILGCASAQRAADLDWSHEISADLSRAVNEALLKPAGLTVDQIDALLHNNLFTPLVVLKERLAGFTPRQLYTDNIPRVGHCFAADPLINLVDRAAAGRVRDGAHYLLAASVPGARLGVLLCKSS
jgi:3-oxoacyl-[acyl-carrier-protein] synthase-3